MRRGYTLVEAMVAGAILVAALVPLLSLLNGSSMQAVKARDRAVAGHLATAVTEEQALRPAPNRANLPVTAAGQLAILKPLVDAHKLAHPADAAALDRTLANYSVSLTVVGAPPTPLRVRVDWTESGEPRRLERDGVLGVP